MLAPLAQGAAAIGEASALSADIMVNATATIADLPPINKLYTLYDADANASATL